jgi:hypothetical protein
MVMFGCILVLYPPLFHARSSPRSDHNAWSFSPVGYMECNCYSRAGVLYDSLIIFASRNIMMSDAGTYMDSPTELLYLSLWSEEHEPTWISLVCIRHIADCSVVTCIPSTWLRLHVGPSCELFPKVPHWICHITGNYFKGKHVHLPHYSLSCGFRLNYCYLPYH